MNKEFVPYEQALALKELGFDEPCVYYVDKDNNSYIYNFQTHPDEFIEGCGVNVIPTPTFSQAFRWFREKYDLRIWIESNRGVLFYEYIIATTNPSFINRQFTNNEVFNTYEEAEQACLDKLIELVKTNETLH